MPSKYKILGGSVQQNGHELQASLYPSRNSSEGVMKVKVDLNLLLRAEPFAGERLEATLSRHLERMEDGENTPLELAPF